MEFIYLLYCESATDEESRVI